ncbi:MAG: hypothetical protein IJR72_02170 [Oscillospiraceae bacterium]|nr:hypothetical protein [Oscillospiraceae bacterium]
MDEMDDVLKELENDEDSEKNFHKNHAKTAHEFSLVSLATLGVGCLLGGFAMGVGVSPLIGVAAIVAAVIVAVANELAANTLRNNTQHNDGM